MSEERLILFVIVYAFCVGGFYAGVIHLLKSDPEARVSPRHVAVVSAVLAPFWPLLVPLMFLSAAVGVIKTLRGVE